MLPVATVRLDNGSQWPCEAQNSKRGGVGMSRVTLTLILSVVSLSWAGFAQASALYALQDAPGKDTGIGPVSFFVPRHSAVLPTRTGEYVPAFCGFAAGSNMVNGSSDKTLIIGNELVAVPGIPEPASSALLVVGCAFAGVLHYRSSRRKGRIACQEF